jgi:SPP1 family predicted phage head-tail adaptor
MNPSLINKRITILQKSEIQNSYGEIENNPVELAKVWANIKTLRGRELFQANQVHNEVTVKVIIRYRSGILPKMKIKYGERVLEIIAPPININEQNRFLELSCKEVV